MGQHDSSKSILYVLGIVAVVAIFAMAFPFLSDTTTLDSSEETLVGQGFADREVDSREIEDGEGDNREVEEYEVLSEEMSREDRSILENVIEQRNVEEERRDGEIESELKLNDELNPAENLQRNLNIQKIVDDYDMSQAVDVSKHVSSPSKGVSSFSKGVCMGLTQSAIDASGNGDPMLDFSFGCVEPVSNLNMSDKALVLKGDFTFDCRGESLAGSGDYGLIVKGDVVVKNCTISGRKSVGFEAAGNSLIQHSTAITDYYGFKLSGSASVEHSSADNQYIGFELSDGASVVDSSATKNNEGFYMTGSSMVDNSKAVNNKYTGFRLFHSASVTDSSSIGGSYSLNGANQHQNRYIGFDLKGSSSVDGSTADNNKVPDPNYAYGFDLKDTSNVSDSLAKKSHMGFDMADSSVVANSIATDNAQGFYICGNPVVVDSKAKNNLYYGFRLYTQSYVEDSTAVSNGQKYGHSGFVVKDSSIVFNSTADNNGEFGFKALDSSKVSDSAARNNNFAGFELLGSSQGSNLDAMNNGGFGIYVDNSASLNNGWRACSNQAPCDIFVNGGTINGKYFTTNGVPSDVGGAGSGQFTTEACT